MRSTKRPPNVQAHTGYGSSSTDNSNRRGTVDTKPARPGARQRARSVHAAAAFADAKKRAYTPDDD